MARGDIERTDWDPLLSLTISVDDDIVDGASAARFSQRLADLIENTRGLDRVCDRVCQDG